MYLKWILILVLMNNLCSCKGVKYDADGRNSWITRMRTIRRDVKDCVKTSGYTTWRCLKLSSLKLFDEMMSSTEIPIWRGIRLVRITDYDNDSPKEPRRNELTKTLTAVPTQRDVEGFVYLEQIAERITRVLRTHALQVSLKEISEAVLDNKGRAAEVHGTPRHRRHRNNMMIAMVFGVTALGAVLVPMGFQILSVVSGKALLLAKMALLLASINGLKKVANSGVHYGLYQVPGEQLGYGYYDRGDVHHPRNIHGLIAQPVEVQV